MKLKYYLRGLGIGILITALIMGISLGGKETLTDAEIRERATQLGMVEESKVLFGNSEKSTLSAPDTKEQIVSDNQAISASSASVSEQVPVSTSADSTVSESKAVHRSEDSSVSMDVPASTSSNASVSKNITVKENVLSDEGKKSGKITIHIATGQSSYSVCEELKRQGVIEDAKAFDLFLCAKGYDRKLVTGEHIISEGATLDEIGIALTK